MEEISEKEYDSINFNDKKFFIEYKITNSCCSQFLNYSKIKHSRIYSFKITENNIFIRFKRFLNLDERYLKVDKQYFIKKINKRVLLTEKKNKKWKKK